MPGNLPGCICDCLVPRGSKLCRACLCRPAAWARSHNLARRWGNPTASAPSTSHSASYPISARSPRTLASPRPTSKGEFSRNANSGRTSLIIRCISRQRPERAPSMPAPFPAAEMSWHGKPPDTTSTRPRHGRPSKVRTSSQTGKVGSSPSFCRASNTLADQGSSSTAQTVRNPSSSLPSIPPPAPAKRCSSFTPPPF